MTALIDYVFLIALVWTMLAAGGILTGNAPQPSRQQPGERGITHVAKELIKFLVLPVVGLVFWLVARKEDEQ